MVRRSLFDNSLIASDGFIHTEKGATSSPDRRKLEPEMLRADSLADAKVCLSCTLPPELCTGDEACFKRMKEILKGETK